MTLIELVVQLVPWAFHLIEDVEAPINGVVLVSVLIGTDVAHSSLTAATILEPLYVRVLVLIVDAAGRDVLGELRCLHRGLLGCRLTSFQDVICDSFHKF